MHGSPTSIASSPATAAAPALTERQVADRLGLSVATLRAWRHRRKGPRYVRFGRAVRYLPHDLDDFVRANVVDTRHECSSNRTSANGGPWP